MEVSFKFIVCSCLVVVIRCTLGYSFVSDRIRAASSYPYFFTDVNPEYYLNNPYASVPWISFPHHSRYYRPYNFHHTSGVLKESASNGAHKRNIPFTGGSLKPIATIRKVQTASVTLKPIRVETVRMLSNVEGKINLKSVTVTENPYKNEGTSVEIPFEETERLSVKDNLSVKT